MDRRERGDSRTAYMEGFKDAMNGCPCEKQDDGYYILGYYEATNGRSSPEREEG